MPITTPPDLTRRQLWTAGGALALAGTLPGRGHAASATSVPASLRLTAEPARALIAGDDQPATAVCVDRHGIGTLLEG